MEETKLTPKQWVLVRDWNSGEWCLNIYSHYSKNGIFAGKYICVASVWNQCIPYEGNEQLLGKTDEPKKPYEPQDGDFIHLEYNDGDILTVICEENEDVIYGYVDYDEGRNKILSFTLSRLQHDGIIVKRPATDEEKQELLDALHEAGKDWDAENKKVVDYVKPYQPEDGDIVFSGYKDVHGEEACHWIAIVKRGNAESYEAYCGVAWENRIKLWTKPEWCDSQEYTRPATDEERKVLISFLHKNGKDWDAERKELIEYKESYVPKPGDFFVLETHVRETKLIAICNRLDGFTLSYYAGTIGKDQREIHLYSYYRLGTRDTVRPATEDERHLLLTKLFEMGKYWNAESRQIMDLVWTPKTGEVFYYPLWDYSIGAFRETKANWYDTLALWIREHRCRTEMECKEMCDKLNANIE